MSISFPISPSYVVTLLLPFLVSEVDSTVTEIQDTPFINSDIDQQNETEPSPELIIKPRKIPKASKTHTKTVPNLASSTTQVADDSTPTTDIGGELTEIYLNFHQFNHYFFSLSFRRWLRGQVQKLSLSRSGTIMQTQILSRLLLCFMFETKILSHK